MVFDNYFKINKNPNNFESYLEEEGLQPASLNLNLNLFWRIVYFIF